jgi:hypothetical protein
LREALLDCVLYIFWYDGIKDEAQKGVKLIIKMGNGRKINLAGRM